MEAEEPGEEEKEEEVDGESGPRKANCASERRCRPAAVAERRSRALSGQRRGQI